MLCILVVSTGLMSLEMVMMSLLKKNNSHANNIKSFAGARAKSSRTSDMSRVFSQRFFWSASAHTPAFDPLNIAMHNISLGTDRQLENAASRLVLPAWQL